VIRMIRTLVFLLAATAVASTGWAEPTFLAKQYTRCTACHYSPTGGGLLTPYGRLLSHRELSTTGGSPTAPASDAEDDPRGEQAFLYGALGNALGNVHLGLEMRPAHLQIGFPGGHQDMNFLMNLDLVGALQTDRWTVYGSIGREPSGSAVRNGRTLSVSGFAPDASCLRTAYGLRTIQRTREPISTSIATIRSTASRSATRSGRRWSR